MSESASGEANSGSNAGDKDSSVPVHQCEEWLRRNYWDKKMSVYDMADVAGVSGRTISYWMDKMGVEKRGNHKRAHAVTNGDTTTAETYRSEEWLRSQYVDENKSVIEMADAAGVTPTTICNWMKAAGLETRAPHQRDHITQSGTSEKLSDRAWLHKKYVERELSTPEIAERIGYTQAAVAYWMRRHDIEWRNSKEAALRGEQHPDWDGGHSLEYGGEWQERREEAIERDDSKCCRCGVTREAVREATGRDLHVHHIQKLKTFGDPSNAHRLGNLLTVCQACHAAIEGLPIDNR